MVNPDYAIELSELVQPVALSGLKKIWRAEVECLPLELNFDNYYK